MSHELRTPLNAIIGFSEVLAQGMFGDINEKQTEYLHDILESGRHLLSLINDILDLSKIEAGRMELELADFDLSHAIQNALTLVRERALCRGIALHHVIGDWVADIRADERKIKQGTIESPLERHQIHARGRPDRSSGGSGRWAGRGLRHGHRGRDRARGPGGRLRRVPASGNGRQEGRGHRTRAGPFPEVHRAPRRTDLGDEPGRRRLDVYIHAPECARLERGARCRH